MRQLAIAAIDTLLALALVLVPPTPPATPPSVEAEGKYLVRIDWPDAATQDVDVYVQTPSGAIVYFANEEADQVFLDHDDLGALSDMDAGGHVLRKNQERATLRGTAAGEYTVNVHLYRGGGPIRVRVRLYSLRGSDRLERDTYVTLHREGDEQTAFRFSLDASGDAGSFTTLPKHLVGAA